MIQRIQTVFLLLVVGLFVVLFFIPLGEITGLPKAAGVDHYPFYLRNEVASLITNILVAGMAFGTIFLYKNRPMQMRLCYVNILLSAVLICLVLIFSREMMKLPAQAEVHFTAGAWLTIGNTVLNFLAARSIARDEALVRSADRLR